MITTIIIVSLQHHLWYFGEETGDPFPRNTRETNFFKYNLFRCLAEFKEYYPIKPLGWICVTLMPDLNECLCSGRLLNGAVFIWTHVVLYNDHTHLSVSIFCKACRPGNWFEFRFDIIWRYLFRKVFVCFSTWSAEIVYSVSTDGTSNWRQHTDLKSFIRWLSSWTYHVKLCLLIRCWF